ncbi:MAG: GWxTD domain-containing protein, partial [Chitinophagales bacterium]
ELRDTANTIVNRKRVFFQRSNSIDEEETDNNNYNELSVITDNFAKKYDLFNIKHHLLALQPLTNELERAGLIGIVKSENIDLMHNYFYSFWKEKDGQDPEAAWTAYAEKLQHVENNYTNPIERGYETDRGIIYLKHGAPDEQTNRSRKSNYGEYEVWTYYSLEDMGTIDFVFSNIDDINDNFQLVHSNLKGEVYDKNWADFLKTGDY